jgi:multicomponent Na+:H+ antiporter subunit D
MSGVLAACNPGWLLILAGLACLLMPMRLARQTLGIAAPLASLVLLLIADLNVDLARVSAFGLDLSLYRVDTLNFIFGFGFLIASLLHSIYTWHEDDRVHDGMALGFAGASVSAVFSGDLVSLFVFWELTALTSVFLIFRAGTAAAYAAGLRYLGFQCLSGFLLLAGIAAIASHSGAVALKVFTALDAPGAMFVFAGLGIKAAFPLVHAWMGDAYPKATPGGAFLMSALTTTLAVYALARLFPGLDALIWIGAVMTVYPVFFAVIENDLRKVLAFSSNNQIGFMVCAIGIGTPLALNGAVAHAFTHILFKGLLFMSMGAVLYRTGTTKITELGGLYKSMPWTALLCIIGALSISAVPLFSGYAAKALTMSAVSKAGAVDPSIMIIWLMLLFASAGVLEHSGIKVPFFAFFDHDRGTRVKEAPFNMLLAMGMAAFFCVTVGLPSMLPGFGYKWLYSLLPYQSEAMSYQPYTLSHALGQMQLLVLAVFAFLVLRRFGLYPSEKNAVVLDADWLWRRPGLGFARWIAALWGKLAPAFIRQSVSLASSVQARAAVLFSPVGGLARRNPGGAMAIWTAAVLAAVLMISFMTFV